MATEIPQRRGSDQPGSRALTIVRALGAHMKKHGDHEGIGLVHSLLVELDQWQLYQHLPPPPCESIAAASPAPVAARPAPAAIKPTPVVVPIRAATQPIPATKPVQAASRAPARKPQHVMSELDLLAIARPAC